MIAPGSFLSIAVEFDAIFMDQYGVLHDGCRPYHGAEEALHRLKEARKKVVILSNSGRSGEDNAERMAKLGLGRVLYDHFLTSGDVARRLLKSEQSPVKLSAATRCLAIAAEGAADFAEVIGALSTSRGDEADFIVISGSQGDRFSMDHYRRLLEPAATRKIPCLCANPDKLMIIGPSVAFGAGRIAELYEELGGSVIWVGKPYPPIYRAGAELIGAANPQRILCVGDSVEHDVVGAHRFGAPAVLVRTGILASLSEEELTSEFEKYQTTPEFIVRDLR